MLLLYLLSALAACALSFDEVVQFCRGPVACKVPHGLNNAMTYPVSQPEIQAWTIACCGLACASVLFLHQWLAHEPSWSEFAVGCGMTEMGCCVCAFHPPAAQECRRLTVQAADKLQHADAAHST